MEHAASTMTKKAPFIATGRRHSYIQRPHSLTGPGAYSIPSTFRQSAINTLLRAVQREHYGREFARMKRNAAASSLAVTTGAAPPAATATVDAINAMGDTGVAFAIDDAPPNADANSTTKCGVVGIRARQPGGVTADKYRRRRDKLRSQVGRQVASSAPASSARSILIATTVPPSPSSVNSASCYDAYVDGYVPATADADDTQCRSPPAEVPAMLPPPPPIQQLHRAGVARGQRESSSIKGHGAPPGGAATSTYERYLASTGYLKRLTLHRQRCLGHATD